MPNFMNSARCAMLGAVLCSVGLAAQAIACEAPAGVSELRQQVINWMNSERRASGFPDLRASSALQSSATAHACDMATRGYFSHEGAGGPSLTQRLRRAGYRFRAANENIAKTSTTSVPRVSEIWRNSPGHMENVNAANVREVGVGIVEAGGKVYWVTNAGKS